MYVVKEELGVCGVNNPPTEWWKTLDLVRKLCWDKMSDYRKQVGLSQADIRMTS